MPSTSKSNLDKPVAQDSATAVPPKHIRNQSSSTIQNNVSISNAPANTLPGSSTKPSKSKGRTKKPRPAPVPPFAISASPHLTPEEKDCLVKAMALPVGDHIASRGKMTPDNVLDEIREDQNTIALAQSVLETPHKGKGKATDKLAPSRNMLVSIGEWLKQEYAQTERCLRELAQAEAEAREREGRGRENGERDAPSSSKVLPAAASMPVPVPAPTPATEAKAQSTQTRRKARKKQPSVSSASPSAAPHLQGVDTKA